MPPWADKLFANPVAEIQGTPLESRLLLGAKMPKTLLYRLFGVGKIPESISAELKREGILLMDEGIRGSTTYIDFRAPGKYSSWRRQWHSASIALTEMRLMALGNSRPNVNVPFSDERIRKLQLSVESDTLCIAFDPGLFHDGWSGTIEYRFHTLQAQLFVDKLRERVGEQRIVRTT
jgi:hypothetical protein